MFVFVYKQQINVFYCSDRVDESRLPVMFACTVLARLTSGCSTVVVGKAASTTGSVMATHSNDGDGDSVGTIARIAAGPHDAGSTRAVAGGSIPEVEWTFAYHTEVSPPPPFRGGRIDS